MTRDKRTREEHAPRPPFFIDRNCGYELRGHHGVVVDPDKLRQTVRTCTLLLLIMIITI